MPIAYTSVPALPAAHAPGDLTREVCMAARPTVVGGRNLARLAEQALERLGDHPALFFEGAWHWSAALAERAARVGAGLRRLGVRPGDRVVVLMANCTEVGVAYTAIWRAGAVVVPVIFLAPAAHVRHIVLDSQAVALVTTTELLPRARAASAGLSLPLIVAGAAAPAGRPARPRSPRWRRRSRAPSRPATTTTWPRCCTPVAPPAAAGASCSPTPTCATPAPPPGRSPTSTA
jgi:acyl-CoA synthetase (AMP-forming)/AMP-acid ligase II